MCVWREPKARWYCPISNWYFDISSWVLPPLDVRVRQRLIFDNLQFSVKMITITSVNFGKKWENHTKSIFIDKLLNRSIFNSIQIPYNHQIYLLLHSHESMCMYWNSVSESTRLISVEVCEAKKDRELVNSKQWRCANESFAQNVWWSEQIFVPYIFFGLYHCANLTTVTNVRV